MHVVDTGKTEKGRLNFRGSFRRTGMGSLQTISGQVFGGDLSAKFWDSVLRAWL